MLYRECGLPLIVGLFEHHTFDMLTVYPGGPNCHVWVLSGVRGVLRLRLLPTVT
jgi:hypothetical protein